MKRILIVLLLVSLLSLSGCGAQKIYFCPDGSIGGNQEITSDKVTYVCPDGREAATPAQCRFTLAPTITQADAEQKALSFVRGYVQANGWTTTLVNAYSDDADYNVQIIISKRDELSYQTGIAIDGEKGVATCEENCDYMV